MDDGVPKGKNVAYSVGIFLVITSHLTMTELNWSLNSVRVE